MKKNIVIVLLVLISGVSTIFGFIRASDASREAIAAKMAQQEAEKQYSRAENIQSDAEHAAADAVRAQAEAERIRAELLECQSK